MAGRAPELPAVAVWGKHRGEDGAAEAVQAISLWPYYASSGGLVLIALVIGQRLDWLSIARVVARLFGQATEPLWAPPVR